MATTTDNDVRVDFGLSREAKATIEEAAALSERDAQVFLNILDAAEPNLALREAAAWYRSVMAAPWQIERLADTHDRSSFSGGQASMS